MASLGTGCDAFGPSAPAIAGPSALDALAVLTPMPAIEASLADAIDRLLPQTQCTKCGYPACRPYAAAIARGEADIDRCPPGGDAGIQRLAALLSRSPKPLDPAHGREQPRAAALIREEWCIGCTLCIQACPVDAIVGAPKQMHTVLTAACTGCELCLPPCPVDCIEMVPLTELAMRGSAAAAAEADVQVADRADLWRTRHAARQARRAREDRERDARLAEKAREKLRALEADPDDLQTARKRAAVLAAIERARVRRLSRP
jgi:electron transport complex protein RnfB